MKIIAVIMKKTQKILSFARFSDRMEVTKINQAKRKSPASALSWSLERNRLRCVPG